MSSAIPFPVSQTDHTLVPSVQQDTGIRDPQQTTQYTRKAVDLMNEHANSNPTGYPIVV